MTHPFKSQAKTGQQLADSRYADGGSVGADNLKGKQPVPMPTTSGTPTGDNMSADTSSNQPDFLKGKVARKHGGKVK